MQDLDVFGSQDSFFFGILLKIFKKNIRHLISFTLAIIISKVVLRQLLSPLNLFKTQGFYIHEAVQVVVVYKNKNFILITF